MSSATKQSSDATRIFKTVGALSLIMAGLSFVVGFALYTTKLHDLADDEAAAAEKLDFIQDHKNIYYMSNIILYIIFGLAQLVATTAMSDRFKDSCPDQLVDIGHGLGIVWSTLVLASGMIGNIGTDVALSLMNEDQEVAVVLWRVIDTIHDTVGGGNEIVGGCWVLVVSISEWLRTKSLSTNKSYCCDFFWSKVTSLLGLVAGIAGIVHTVPGLDDAAAVFGVTMIVWYILSGVLLYTTKGVEKNSITDEQITV